MDLVDPGGGGIWSAGVADGALCDPPSGKSKGFLFLLSSA